MSKRKQRRQPQRGAFLRNYLLEDTAVPQLDGAVEKIGVMDILMAATKQP